MSQNLYHRFEIRIPGYDTRRGSAVDIGSGFALVEMLVTLAAASVLLALAAPAIRGAMLASEEGVSTSNARSCAMLLMAHAENGSGFFPTAPKGGPLISGFQPTCAVRLDDGNSFYFDWFGHSGMWPVLLLSRGEVPSGAWFSPSRRPGTDAYQLTDYVLTHAVLARAAFWARGNVQNTDDLVPQRLSAVRFASKKAVVFEANNTIASRHGGRSDWNVPRPVAFFDGHCQVLTVTDAVPGVPNRFLGGGAYPLLGTDRGVNGFDYH